MITYTKKTISALLMALLVGMPLIQANNEEILSPFRNILNAVSQGGKVPIVINQHITHVEAPATENSTALSSIVSFMKNVAFKGCSLAYKLGTTQAGLYCTSALLISGLAYYNRKVIVNTVKDAHKKTREIIKKQIDELDAKLTAISAQVFEQVKTFVKQENNDLKGWFSKLLSSNQEELKAKLEKIQEEQRKERAENQKKLEDSKKREEATLKQLNDLEKKLAQAQEEHKKIAEENAEENAKKLQELQVLINNLQLTLEIIRKDNAAMKEDINAIKTCIGSPEKDSSATVFGILRRYLPTFGATN